MVTIDVGPVRPDDEICDFCSEPQVVTSYACISFDVGKADGVTLASAGGWTACQSCKELIDAEKWDELAERGADGIMKNFFHNDSGISRSSIREVVCRLHQRFRAARKQTQ